jgi:hypothetical protein
VELRLPRVIHPDICHCVTRTEPQGLGNMRLRFFGVTDMDLAISDNGMGGGEISI